LASTSPAELSPAIAPPIARLIGTQFT